MGHLNELQDTYGDKGFTVIAITNEERGKVDKFVEDYKPSHPIVIESGDSSKTWDAGGFPSAFLIAPNGKIAWSGHPGGVEEKTIEELLTKAKLFPDLVRSLVSVRKAIEKGKLYDAQKALQKKRDVGLSEEETPWADKLEGWLTWNRDAATRRAERAVEGKDYYTAWRTYTTIAKSWKGADFAKEAGEKAKELLTDKEKKVEIDAGKKLASICKKLGKMSPKKAIKQLERMTSKKYRDTAAGKQAAKMIKGYKEEIQRLK